MSAPRWTRALLRLVAPADRTDDLLGDLEEAHRRRVGQRGRLVGTALTALETLDMAVALFRLRRRRRAAPEGQGPSTRGRGAPLVPSGEPRPSRTGISWLDVKLGVRMLIKHPGLTLVGGLGMAVAIALGAGSYDLVSAAFDATLPFEGGERVVALESWDTEINNQERQILHDFATWRQELGSVEELGAWRTVGRNLITPDGMAGAVPVAEMTVSGFRLAGVSPLMGRHLIPEDERADAPPVVVLGYDAWQSRFLGDPQIVGKTVRLGDAPHTVVGVMPEGFGFPVYHQFWVPLRADPRDWERGEGPEIFVFGRLAPNATLEQARAELETLGRRAADAFPETHGHLRPLVVRYTTQFLDDGEIRDARGWQAHLLQLPVLLLLGVICVNVAILVYARTATRHGEIAVRTALGASRRRIVAQLFAEALVLSGGAAVLGLGVAAVVLRRIEQMLDAVTFIPFWMDFGLSPGTALYAGGLALLAAVLVGVLPALKATGPRIQSSLRELGGGTGMRMGRTWTALIVAQVAIAVALLPAAALYSWEFTRYGFADPGFPAEEYLTARLVMDRQSGPDGEDEADAGDFATRWADRLADLERRLEAEAAVAAVSFASHSRGDQMRVRLEADGVPMPSESATGHLAGAHLVDLDFFDAFDLSVVAGRAFHSGDLSEGANAVVVNRTFAEEVLGGGNAVGRRIRYTQGYRSGGIERIPQGVEVERWYEIVGVVSDLLAGALEPGAPEARLYHARAPGQIHPATIFVRMRRASPATFAPHLREITTAVDPTLQPRSILPLDQVLGDEQTGLRLGALGIVLVMLSVLLLSAAGIHALMGFTVARRRREIGIRAALGARPRRLLASVFRRAAVQLGIGVAVGLAVAALVDGATGGELLAGRVSLLLPAVAVFMMAVGLLAALGPARRGLRVEPTEALRADG